MYENKYTQSQMARVPGKSLSTWGLVLINGIAALGLGILLLVSPGTTIRILGQLLGLFFLVAGFMAIVSMCINTEKWGLKLVAGLAGILGGLIVLQNPAWTAIIGDTTLLITLAVIGIVMGIAYLVQAFQGGGWGHGIIGAVILIFGIILLLSPFLGALVLPYVLGVCGLIGGVIAIYVAFRLRGAEAPTH